MEEKKTYFVRHWLRWSNKPLPNARPDTEAVDSEHPEWTVELTPSELVALADTYDVMVKGTRCLNVGSRRKPEWVDVPPTVWLDDSGGGFRTRRR